MTLFPERKAQKKQVPKTTFSERVVKLALTVPAGKVTTYGALAHAAGGGAMASQSITTILGKAWNAGERGIPFHRIIYSDGRVWINDEHKTKRMALYKKEGIRLDAQNRVVGFRDILVEF